MTAAVAIANIASTTSYGSSIAFKILGYLKRSHRLWLSARALVVNNSGSEDLWLSATGAVVNGGRWLRCNERCSGKIVPGVRLPPKRLALLSTQRVPPPVQP